MRTRVLASLPTSALVFAALPLHDLEVADYAALSGLDIGLHAGRRVLVKSTGEVFRYEPKAEDGKGCIFVEEPFSGGTSSAISVTREEQAR